LAQLTFGPYAYFPNWSPDGSKIAYYQTQEHETRLYLMELDGSGEVPLTPAF
jgi:Tol biopolymer transport system component